MLSNEEAAEKKKKENAGCLVRGCLMLLIFFFLFVGSLGWGAYSMIKQAYALTSPIPDATPIYSPRENEEEELHQRISSFEEKSSQHQLATLTLSADDLNTLVASDPSFSAAQGHVFFKIQNGQIDCQVSFPLDYSPFQQLHGRYLNGEVRLNGSMEDGILTLQPTYLKAGNTEAALWFLKALQSYHWGDLLNQIPEFKSMMNQVTSVSIKEDQMTITGK